MSKQLQQSDKIVQSLLELKDELQGRMTVDPTIREVVLKINSCLFNEYPILRQTELPLSNPWENE